MGSVCNKTFCCGSIWEINVFVFMFDTVSVHQQCHSVWGQEKEKKKKKALGVKLREILKI